jgi:hypothetical protein
MSKIIIKNHIKNYTAKKMSEKIVHAQPTILHIEKKIVTVLKNQR